MKISNILLLVLALVLALAACSSTASPEAPEAPEATGDGTPVAQQAPGRMMGPGSGMMARHHATVPEPYAGVTNPVPADEESLARGAELYATYCTACHGEGGMGDGPAGQALDPLPAPIAHTSRMLGDDYLFWRVSEGGLHEPFLSAMPRWQDVLDEQARWDVINYVRALGSGAVRPGQGGTLFDPEQEAARHAEIAAAAVEQGLITAQESDVFLEVHTHLDALVAAGAGADGGGMETVQEALLARLVAEGQISEEQAGQFREVHERLLASGLME